MKAVRLFGLGFITMVAASVAAAPVASAALPEFDPAVKNTFTTTGTETVLRAPEVAETVVRCRSNTSAGEIINAMEIGNMVIHFQSCVSSGSGGSKCTVKSVGAGEGEIATGTLRGQLGVILPKPATGSNVGLLLLPSSGRTWFILAPNGCTEESQVTGSSGVAGVVEPIGSLQKTSKLVIHETAGNQDIELIDLLGGRRTTALLAFGSLATLETTESFTYEKSVEVS
jgi:hypothetical protein